MGTGIQPTVLQNRIVVDWRSRAIMAQYGAAGLKFDGG
jgi:hypothetical protein